MPAPISADKARAICTAAEYKLVRDSAAKHIAGLTPAQLRAAVARSRKLRDKQRDLADRQRRIVRGKADHRKKSGPPANNKNTLLKLDLFQLALDRFEAQLSKSDAAATKQAATKKASAKRKPTRAEKVAATPTKPAKTKSAKASTASTTSAVKPQPASKSSANALFARSGSLSFGHDPNAATMAARQTSLLAHSDRSAVGRHESIIAETANARIRGHMIGSQRKSQAKRDAVQRVGRAGIPNSKRGG